MQFKKYSKLPDNFFKLVFWNTFPLYSAVFIVLGLLALFGIKPVEFNDEPTYGFIGLLVSLVMAPFMSLFTAFAVWILLFVGNFILRIFVKLLESNQ